MAACPAAFGRIRFGDLELRSNAVGGCHEHRFPVTRDVRLEETAESADVAEDVRRKGRSNRRLRAGEPVALASMSTPAAAYRDFSRGMRL